MGLEGSNERRIEVMLRSDQVQLGKEFRDDLPKTPVLTKGNGAIGRRPEKARQGNETEPTGVSEGPEERR